MQKKDYGQLVRINTRLYGDVIKLVAQLKSKGQRISIKKFIEVAVREYLQK